MRKKIVIKQTGFKDCAVACLLSIIRYYNGNVSKDELTYFIKTSADGTTAYHMIEGMKRLGFDGYGVKSQVKELILSARLYPVIAHVKINNILHYLVVYKVNTKRKYFLCMDPAYGMKKISFDKFNEIFLNTFLIIYPVNVIPNIKESGVLLKLIFKQLFSKREWLVLLFSSSFLVMAFTIVNNYYLKLVIDYLLINYSKNILILTIMFFILIIILKNIFDFIRGKLLIKINDFVSGVITTYSIKHVFSLPYNFFKTKPSGEVLSRINELNNFRNFFSQLLLTIFVDTFLIFFSMIILFLINKTLFFIAVVAIIIYLFVVLVYSYVYKEKIEAIQTEQGIYNQHLVESLEGYESIKNLNLISEFSEKLIISFSKFINKIKSFHYSLLNQNFIKNTIFDLSTLFILSSGVYFIINKTISLGDLVVYNTLLIFFTEPIKQLLDMQPNIKYLKTSYQRMNDLLMIKKEEINSLQKKLIYGNLLIKNLKYSYNDIDCVFQNINLVIKKGTKLLIYGKSGCGKSTFIKLLLKYMDNYEGEIYINNLNLKDLNKEVISNSFAYVSQNEMLFADTLKNNIFLNRNVSLKTYEEVLKISKVDLIRSNKKFRDMFFIEENGFNLSGGERQKIVLARALMRKFNYLILDEALSEVGFKEEKEIINNLFEKYQDKTIIYISHKKEIIESFNNKYEFY